VALRPTFTDSSPFSVYSLRKYKLGTSPNPDFVRIGETNCLERRLHGHFTRYNNQVDEYDFCKLKDASNRKTEEKRLLNEYQDAHGGLSKLNTISS